MPFLKDDNDNPVYVFGYGDLVLSHGTDSKGKTCEFIIDSHDGTEHVIGEYYKDGPAMSGDLNNCLRLRFEKKESLRVFIEVATELLDKM